jgi:LysM repeat protein
MGGESVSPEYFTLAQERLLEAEELVEAEEYEQAEQVLSLAEFYAGQVIILVYERDDLEVLTGTKSLDGQSPGEVSDVTIVTQPSRTKPAPPKPKKVHVVRPGESLWTIAAQRSVYGDALQWPLIYKANRDQIKDPRQIYPKQELDVPRNVSPKEVEEARDMARSSEVFPIPAPVRRPVRR